jgi:hypothetical protein
MFLESIHQYAHSIIPQLDAPVMQSSRQKRLSRVKSKTYQTHYMPPIVWSRLIVYSVLNEPFTRLLLDSNLVSITDMVVWLGWVTNDQGRYCICVPVPVRMEEGE